MPSARIRCIVSDVFEIGARTPKISKPFFKPIKPFVRALGLVGFLF
jgi:hypothetical protein